MKSVYAFNDLYPFSNATQTTSGETIPEDVERQHYHETEQSKQSTRVNRSDGKTETVDTKMILIAIAVFVALAVGLNLME